MKLKQRTVINLLSIHIVMEIVSLLVKLIVCMAALLVSNTAAQSDEDGSGEGESQYSNMHVSHRSMSSYSFY